MSALGDPADRTLDAAADGAFGGKHEVVNRRAGYTDPLGWALKIARQGGTLAAGEGKLIVDYYEGLLQAAFVEGWHSGYWHDADVAKLGLKPEALDAWEASDLRKEAASR